MRHTTLCQVGATHVGMVGLAGEYGSKPTLLVSKSIRTQGGVGTRVPCPFSPSQGELSLLGWPWRSLEPRLALPPQASFHGAARERRQLKGENDLPQETTGNCRWPPLVHHWHSRGIDAGLLSVEGTSGWPLIQHVVNKHVCMDYYVCMHW